MTQPVRLLMPIVIAVALGPLIAGLAVCVLMVGNSLVKSEWLPLADMFTMFGVYIVASYILGWLIALIAGILVSIWMMFRPPSLVVALAAAIVGTAIYLGIVRLGLLPAEASALGNLVLTFSLAAIAGAGCWLVMRRFAPGPVAG